EGADRDAFRGENVEFSGATHLGRAGTQLPIHRRPIHRRPIIEGRSSKANPFKNLSAAGNSNLLSIVESGEILWWYDRRPCVLCPRKPWLHLVCLMDHRRPEFQSLSRWPR